MHYLRVKCLQLTLYICKIRTHSYRFAVISPSYANLMPFFKYVFIPSSCFLSTGFYFANFGHFDATKSAQDISVQHNPRFWPAPKCRKSYCAADTFPCDLLVWLWMQCIHFFQMSKLIK